MRRAVRFASLIVAGSAAACGWAAASYPPTNHLPPLSLHPRQFSVLTMNTWRLREPGRVPRLLAALRRLGATLREAEWGDTLPDVLALQELEGRETLASLEHALAPTHTLAHCVCARDAAGANHSVVALALRRGRFATREPQCIDLGAISSDHPRCALRVATRMPDAPARLELVTVHLGARPLNGDQAARLLAALGARGVLASRNTLVVGDFNAAPDTRTYRLMTAGPLRDAMPPERGMTHWFGGRIDDAFAGPGLTLVRALDQRSAMAIVAPSSALTPPPRCARAEARHCPVSDHLPEGGVFHLEADGMNGP